MRFKVVTINSEGLTRVIVMSADPGVELMTKARELCDPGYRVDGVYIAPRCEGCLYEESSQWKHMEPGGCLEEE